MSKNRVKDRQQLIVNSELENILNTYFELREQNISYCEGNVFEEISVYYIFQSQNRLWKKFSARWNNTSKHVFKCDFKEFRNRIDTFLKKEKYLVWKKYAENLVLDYYDYINYLEDCPSFIMKLLYGKDYTAEDAAIQIAIWPKIYKIYSDKWPELDGRILYSPSTPFNNNSN